MSRSTQVGAILVGLVGLTLSGLAGCAAGADRTGAPPLRAAAFPDLPYADWNDDEPDYRLYAGDQLEVRVPSAPELNKAVTVQPDGRIAMPLINPVMVADRSVAQAQAALTQAYDSQLVHPQVEISVVQATPLKVFVGGEVDKAGVYDMPGPIDALQAVIQAGGFKASAATRNVVIIRRGPDGRAMMRTVNLARGLADPAHTNVAPLRRFDIVYVPRSGVSAAGVFVQQYLRDLLPLQFSYAIGGTYTTVGR